MPSLYQKFNDLMKMDKSDWFLSDRRDLDVINYGIGGGCIGDSPTNEVVRDYLMPSQISFIEGKWAKYFGGHDGEKVHGQ